MIHTLPNLLTHAWLEALRASIHLALARSLAAEAHTMKFSTLFGSVG